MLLPRPSGLFPFVPKPNMSVLIFSFEEPCVRMAASCTWRCRQVTVKTSRSFGERPHDDGDWYSATRFGGCRCNRSRVVAFACRERGNDGVDRPFSEHYAYSSAGRPRVF